MTMLSKDQADAVAEAMRSQNRLAGDRFGCVRVRSTIAVMLIKFVVPQHTTIVQV
jgi:hypothetical protein